MNTLQLDPAIAAARKATRAQAATPARPPKAPPPAVAPRVTPPVPRLEPAPWVAAGEFLRSTYPVFDREAPVPLAIGIHRDIGAAHPDLSRNAIRGFLLRHTQRRAYRQGLTTGAPRFGLDGMPCGEVTAKQAATALAQHHQTAQGGLAR